MRRPARFAPLSLIRLRAFLPVFPLIALAVLFGCKSKESAADAAARVNGKMILRSEVEKYYRNQTSGAPQEPAGEQAASLRLNILGRLIDDEIMMQRAEKLGLLATDEEVDAKFNEFKAGFTREEFEQRLKTRSITPDDFKRDLRRSITTDKVLNKEIVSRIAISDADISSYYKEHKAEFNLIEPQHHLAQIVVTTQPDPQVNNRKNSKAQNEAEARRKVQELMNRLESGEDFATLAMNYSEQPETAGNGGDMGFFPESQLRSDPQAHALISKLKAGQTSMIEVYDPPRSRRLAGFRIVKLISRELAGQRVLQDPRVQQHIRQQLRDRREQLLKAAYLETLRNEARVENYYAQQILKNAGQK